MAENGTFTTKVELVDQATAKLKTLNKEFRAAQAPMRAYQKELAQYNKLSGYDAAMKARAKHLDDMKKGFSSLRGHIGQVTKPLVGLGKTLAGVIGVGSIMGIVGLTRQFANWGQEIRNASALLGVTGEKVIQLNQMSKLTGIDQIGGLKNYQDTQAQAAAGMNAGAQYADNILGINPNMKFEDAQLKAMKRVQALRKNGQVNEAGGRNLLSAAGFDPGLMDQDIARFERLQAIANQNAKETAKYSKAAEELSDKFNIAGGRVGVLATRLEDALAPAIGSLLDSFIQWSKNGDNVNAIMNDIKSASDSVAQAIKAIDWKTVGHDITTVYHTGKKLLDAIGGPQGLLIAFGALKAIQLAGWATGVIADIVRITTAFTGMTAAADAAKAATLVPAAGIGLAGGAAILAAGGAAVYGVGSAVKTILHNRTDQGRLEGNRLKMKDSFYGANRYSELEKNGLQYQGMDYLVKKKGYTPQQAAAVMAQARAESGFNTLAIGDGGSAENMFQWHQDRRKAIEAHFGKSISGMSLTEQLDAYDWELHNGEKKAGNELFSANNLNDATKAGLDSERPGEYQQHGVLGTEFANRRALAQNALSGYMPNSTPQTPKADVSGEMKISLDINHKGQVTEARIGQHNLPFNPKIGDVKTQTTSQPRVGGR